jgi:hypothetical protein
VKNKPSWQIYQDELAKEMRDRFKVIDRKDAKQHAPFRDNTKIEDSEERKKMRYVTALYERVCKYL